MDPTQITYDMVTKKLREIVTTRGKKGVDRSEQVGETRRDDIEASACLQLGSQAVCMSPVQRARCRHLQQFAQRLHSMPSLTVLHE